MKNVPIVVNPKSSFNTPPVFTIWFESDDIGQKWSIDVVGLSQAQEAWDRLCSIFLMVSARP
jgi:hypothetical protein